MSARVLPTPAPPDYGPPPPWLETAARAFAARLASPAGLARPDDRLRPPSTIPQFGLGWAQAPSATIKRERAAAMGTTAAGQLTPMTYGMPGDFSAWLTSATKLLEHEPDWSWRDTGTRDAAMAMRDLITSRLEAAGCVT